MIRVVVVDDEPLGRQGVLARLEKHRDMEVAGVFEDGQAALPALLAAPPDLLLLDIQMPAIDGMSLLGAIPPESRPFVIFLTAHEQFALQAFSYRAVDYLLKPIDDDRFDESLNRAREQLRHRARDMSSSQRSTEAEGIARRTRFSVRIGRRQAFIHAKDVVWIGAEGDYITLHTATGQYLVRESLSALADQLDPSMFARIHRSTIVRVDCVAEVTSLFNKDALARLHDGTPLRVSRTYTAALMTLLKDKHTST